VNQARKLADLLYGSRITPTMRWRNELMASGHFLKPNNGSLARTEQARLEALKRNMSGHMIHSMAV
jgi:hypothetical protein